MAGTRRTPRALFCDTNVIVRLLTDDPPAQARAAARALDAAGAGRATVILPDVVLAELAYVLTEVYGLAAADAAERIRSVLDLPGIEAADAALARAALAIWGGGRLDFADAYLAALSKGTSGTGVLSFDRDYDRIEGVTRVDPAEFGAKPKR